MSRVSRRGRSGGPLGVGAALRSVLGRSKVGVREGEDVLRGPKELAGEEQLGHCDPVCVVRDVNQDTHDIDYVPELLVWA